MNLSCKYYIYIYYIKVEVEQHLHDIYLVHNMYDIFLKSYTIYYLKRCLLHIKMWKNDLDKRVLIRDKVSIIYLFNVKIL